MTKILVPLDGSELAEAALVWLKLLSDASDSEVLLVQVVERTEGGDAALDAVNAYLSGKCEELSVPCRARTLRGEPAEGIVACAAEEQVDQILMATHGRSGLRRWIMGSVAEAVLRRTSCPVFLVGPDPAPTEGLKRILVAHDGSEGSDAVLPHVKRLATRAQAAVTLLRVWPFIPTAIPSPVLNPELHWNPEDLRKSLASRKEDLEGAGLTVEIETRLGHEPTEILSTARDADVIALSTHGRSGLARWWFGSVSEQVLRAGDKPLLIVRTGSPATPTQPAEPEEAAASTP